MSASSERGPGRPPGITEARLAKQAKVCQMADVGISVAQIAALEKIDPAYVRILIADGKKRDGPAESAADIEPPQPRRLSRRAAQVRAWEHAEQHVISKLGLAVDAFWVRIVVAIHQEGDGYRLGIGEPGCRFRSRDDLADLFGRRVVEIDDWLAALVEHGRLLQVGDVDIGIPPGMKLTPAENIRVKKRTAQPPRDGQMPMLHTVLGGLSDATENPPQTQIISQLNLRSDELNLHPTANNIPENANNIPIKFASLADGRTAAAAAYAKESNLLAAAVADKCRAGDATENPIKFASDATENPLANGVDATEINSKRSAEVTLNPLTNGSDATEINSKRSPVALMTEELGALAGLGRAPNADDLGIVEAWLKAGETADSLKTGIEIKMKQRDGRPPSKLRYFNGFLIERREARERDARSVFALPQTGPPATIAPAAAPPATLNDADLALAVRLRAIKHPNPPNLADFQADATAALAHRWLDAGEAWVKTGRRQDLKPPDFALATMARSIFEGDLIAVEEALTEPDPPEAAD